MKALIGINILVFIAWNRSTGAAVPLLIDHFVLTGQGVLDGRVWTLLTTCFSHLDATHLLLNLLGLYVFGVPVRAVVGDKGLLKLYLLGGLAASFAHVLANLANGTDAGAVGASGSVMAIAVVFAALFPQVTLLLNFFIPIKAWLAVLLFIGIDLVGAFGVTGVDAVLSPGNNIAHAAHLGGALFGGVYYALWLRPKLSERRE
jgi:membrane associated rhomboid family serine protease